MDDNSLQDLIKRIGIFKRLRPKTPDQAERFFYCKILDPGSMSFLSGKACAERHKKHSAIVAKLKAENATPIDYEIARCLPCGECELGAMRVELLKKRRKKNERKR